MKRLGIGTVQAEQQQAQQQQCLCQFATVLCCNTVLCFAARLTERQQLALALEESLKAAHAPAHHEAALSDPHRGSFEGEHSSRSRAANSDDESSAEPSAQQRAIPAACSPRKRRRDSDETDLSSTSQSFGRAGITAKEHSSKPVAAPKDVHGAKDKGNSCSESSRQSHSTALPAIRVSLLQEACCYTPFVGSAAVMG